MKCNKCGNDNADSMSFCTVCGESLKSDAANTGNKENHPQPTGFAGEPTICHICNTKICGDTIYCHMCGSRQKIALPNTETAGVAGSEISDAKESKAVDKCSICGKDVPLSTQICAACDKAASKSGLEKTESEAVDKFDPKQIELMIAKIKTNEIKEEKEKAEQPKIEQSEKQQEEEKEGQAEETKKEQVKTEEPQKEQPKQNEDKADKTENNKTNENKSTVAQEFLPSKHSAGNSVGLNSAKNDSAKKTAANLKDKKQQNNQVGVAKIPETKAAQEKEIPQHEKDSQFKKPNEKINSGQLLGEQSKESKTVSIKTQSITSSDKASDRKTTDPENRSSQWTSVAVAGGSSNIAVPAKLPVSPQLENKKPPEFSGKQYISGKGAPAQAFVSARPPIAPQLENKKPPELPKQQDSPAKNMPAQTPIPVKPPVSPQQAAKPMPTVSAELYSALADTKKKGKKAVFAVLVILIIVLLGAAFGVYYMVRSSNYEQAVQYMNAGQYAEAYEIFGKLGNYEDSAESAAECYKFVRYDEAAELMSDARYDEAAVIFSELGDFKDSGEMFYICTLFSEAIDFYNDTKYWSAYSTFEKLNGYGDSSEWMEKCIQNPPVNGIADKGEEYAEGTASIKVVNATVLDVLFIINTADGRYWGGIYIKAGTDATVAIKPNEYSANLAAGTKWFGIIDMFGRGSDASYQQNVPVDDQGNTSFYVSPNETKAFTIYSQK